MVRIWVLISAFCCHFITSGGEVKRPRGVAISKASLYATGDTFQCFDGSSVIPYERINDDYCDCSDGSDEPGTSACPNGSFHCTNAGHKPKYIPSSRVNDAICDCCDGSDEYNGKITCANYCRELGKQYREDEEKERQLLLEGHEIYKEYSSKGQEAIKEKRVRLDVAKLEKESAETKRDDLEAKKLEAEAPEKEAKDKHKKAWDEEKERRRIEKDRDHCREAFDDLDSDDDNTVTVSEIQSHPEFDIDSNGAVSVEEAKEYLEELDQADHDTFSDKVWIHIRDIYKKPSAEGSTEPEVEEEPKSEEYQDEATERFRRSREQVDKHVHRLDKRSILDNPDLEKKLDSKLKKYPFKMPPSDHNSEFKQDFQTDAKFPGTFRFPKGANDRSFPSIKPSKGVPVKLNDDGEVFPHRYRRDVNRESPDSDPGEDEPVESPDVGKWKYQYDDQTGKYKSSIPTKKPAPAKPHHLDVDRDDGDLEGDDDEEDDDEYDEDMRGDPEDYHVDDDDDDDDDEKDEKEDAEMPPYDEETRLLIKAADDTRFTYNDASADVNRLDDEIRNLEKTLALEFGPDSSYYPIKGECYEFTDREYTYKFCPFEKCSQRGKHGGVETSLGLWDDWSGDEDHKYTTMRFTKGQNCWNGPDRSVTVLISCGVDNQLRSSSEPNRCEYQYTFTSPAACSKPPEPAVKDPEHDEL